MTMAEIEKSRRQPTDEQAAAKRQLRTFARAQRYRVVDDEEGFPIIPGRLGRIESFCDGRDCHGCPLPGELALAVWSDRPRLFAKLWAIPGVRRWQTGDQEIRAVFPVEALDQVAGVIRARRRAVRPMTPEQLVRLAVGRQKLVSPRMTATSGG